jgi:TetR/AcrR family transcriptional regulator of autoinduction and epiphytic fitness
MLKGSFRERVFRVRQDAIVDVVNRLLAVKGFEQMTVDEVAADVGIAKASLYKHFPSKEALAAAALARALERALEVIAQLEARKELDPLGRLKAVARWALQRLLADEMPILPAHHTSLRAALAADRACGELLVHVSDELGEWILQAQAEGQIDRSLPPELVLYTLFARTCDPVAGLMKASGRHEEGQIVEWVLDTCFTGLGTRPS